MLAMLLPVAGSTAASHALTVRLADALSGQSLPGQNVNLLERLPSGATQWRAKGTTDQEGLVRFHPTAGRTYELRASPYGPVVSQLVTRPDWQGFFVGRLAVRVLSKTSGEPVAGRKVTLLEQRPDDSLDTVLSAHTDAAGWVRMDPPGLDDAARFVVEVKRLLDGSVQRTRPRSGRGTEIVRVSDSLLTVRLRDALSGAPVRAEQVDAYEVLPAGTYEWRAKGTSDDDGKVMLELPGLGGGRVYELRTHPFGPVVRQRVSAPGWRAFVVGRVQVTLVSATTGEPLPDREVQWLRKESDGTSSLEMGLRTDATGVVRVDPEGWDAGHDYVLATTRLADGTDFRVRIPNDSGRHTLAIPDSLLKVRMIDAVSGAFLAGQTVNVVEVLTGGATKWHTKGVTDADGRVDFELPGLGVGRSYELRARPYGSTATRAVTRPGWAGFPVGRLQVVVRSGLDNRVLHDSPVELMELTAGGLRYVSTEGTDSVGRVRLDPAGLDAGRRYALRAHSLLDGQPRLSDTYTAPGEYTFVVGSPPVRVTLRDAIDATPLKNVEVTVLERVAGDHRWVARHVADGKGKLVLDLPGVDGGREYVLRAYPFGRLVEGSPIRAPGDHLFEAGTVRVKVIDDATGQRIPGMSVTAHEKRADGSLRYLSNGVTDGAGLDRFDFPDLGAARPHLFRVKDPFGEARSYYSPLFTAPGVVELRLRQGEQNKPDTDPPTVTILSPGTDSAVATSGFTVVGRAHDAQALDWVTLSVSVPGVGWHKKKATLDRKSGLWRAHVPASWLEANATATLTARARDEGLNSTSHVVRVRVVVDRTSPELRITSHGNGHELPASGAVITGTLVDDTGGVELRATFTDSSLGTVYRNRSIDVSSTGRFAVAVLAGEVRAGSVATLKLNARDRAGNATAKARTLNVVPPDLHSLHLLNRATFGPTPELLESVEGTGADVWLERQLSPESIPDPVIDDLLAGVTPQNLNELQRMLLLRAVYSERQLQEVMAWFWENHFSTNFNAHGNVSYEFRENNDFRTHALGRFRDLLGISARSSAMLKYLNGVSNVEGAPNENYARELLELHTLGVDGGYTQHDVEEIARAFTGWSLKEGWFDFRMWEHDTRSKQLLGVTLPAGGGVEDGETVLDLLAEHARTAEFICHKLVAYFVSDRPGPSLVADCADTFLARSDAPDQMARVVRRLLRSDAFASPDRHLGKTRTPLEMVAATLRLLGAQGSLGNLPRELRQLGMPLFLAGPPTGYAEHGSAWISTGFLFERAAWLSGLAVDQRKPASAWVPGLDFFTSRGYETAEGIIGFLMHTILPGQYSDLEWILAQEALDLRGTSRFDMHAVDADHRVRNLLRTVLSFPEYQLQ